mmetsp:Transcript_133032/g.332006  ORF Transcript_133032/g.332006 Transcript_133032/m.332006 type:complete len:202 (+) Transcript_133032:607-1212(+)
MAHQVTVLNRKIHPELKALLRVDGVLAAGAKILTAVAELDCRAATMVACLGARSRGRLFVVRARVTCDLKRVLVHLHEVELGTTNATHTICIAIVIMPVATTRAGHRDQEEGDITTTRGCMMTHVHVHPKRIPNQLQVGIIMPFRGRVPGRIHQIEFLERLLVKDHPSIVLNGCCAFEVLRLRLAKPLDIEFPGLAALEEV